MKYILVLLLGFILHKVCYEVINLNAIYRYKSCLNTVKHGVEKSPYQQCRHNLEYNLIENIILYQPEFWDKNK